MELAFKMLTQALLSCAVVAVMVLLPATVAAQAEKDSTTKDAAFCGPTKEKHRVVKHKEQLTPEPATGKVIVYFYWRGSGIRSWAGVQTKLGLDGKFVAVLSKNTYSFVQVDPGLQKFCVEGSMRKTSINSFLFLTAEPGKTYYLQGKPGGDAFGTHDPTLIEVSEEDGRKAVNKSQYVTFEVKK